MDKDRRGERVIWIKTVEVRECETDRSGPQIQWRRVNSRGEAKNLLPRGSREKTEVVRKGARAALWAHVSV
jgi:hypothetical protein